MSAKSTPGPWFLNVTQVQARIPIEENDGKADVLDILDASGAPVPWTLENVRRMAAAPRLIEALLCAPIPSRNEEMMEFRDRQDRWLRKLYQPAIAQALGDA